MVEAVNVLRGRNDSLFTTGGIGPTPADITVDSIAAAVGVDVVIHPRARSALQAYYTDTGVLNEQRLPMAPMPAGAELIAPGMSGAPGIRMGNILLMSGMWDTKTGHFAGP